MPPKKKRKTFEELSVAELRDMYEDAEKPQSDGDGTQPGASVQCDRLRRSVFAQLLAQMAPPKDLSDAEEKKLKGAGRDLVVVMPNVSQEMMAALTLDKVDDNGNLKDKHADHFFDSVPQKSQPNGAFLKLHRMMSFKYVKTQCELRISASYKWHQKPKPKKMPRPQKALKNAGESPGRAAGREAASEGVAEAEADAEAEAEDDAEEAAGGLEDDDVEDGLNAAAAASAPEDAAAASAEDVS